MGLRASIANAQAYGANPVAFYHRLTGSGEGYRAVVPFDLFGPNLLLNDPELVRAILLSPHDGAFGKDGLRFFTVVRRLLGGGVFVVDGDAHRRQRRLVQPILRPRSLALAGAAMTSAARRLRDELAAGGERVVDVEAAASGTAGDLLSVALGGERRAGDLRELARLAALAEGPLLRILKAPLVLPERVPTPANRRLAGAARDLREGAERLLRSCRSHPPEPGSLLAQLLEQGLAAGAGDDELVDELMTLVVAGHQSTAAAIMFTLHTLAAHPEAARRVADEAAGVLAGRPATVDDLPALPYTGAVVAEAIRLYPPVWIITRRVRQATDLGGRALRSGTVLHICPSTLHRNPAHWPEPDRFLPERFATADGRHRFAYAPFGDGPHKCVGNHFALMATTIVVATVGAAVRFAPPRERVRVSARSFLIPEDGLRLTVAGLTAVP